ncbi:hypothetical protein ACYOEI_00500 [Singulisphaera rosea]
MFAKFTRNRIQRRGVVLVVILGMLGLLALIGVTFATFSGQAKVNARNFSQAMNTPDTAEIMDFALAQLIDDTTNPQSAIRGHSLKRDMYGNDATHNGFLAVIPSTGTDLEITGYSVVTAASTIVNNVNVTGFYKLITNIPNGDESLYGFNFARWILRMSPGVNKDPFNGNTSNYFVGTTYEVVADDPTDSSGFRALYVQRPDPVINKSVINPLGAAPVSPITSPNVSPANFANYLSPETSAVQSSLLSLDTLISPPTGVTTYGSWGCTLDGRYLHAFNGPGMDGLGANPNFVNVTPPGGTTTSVNIGGVGYGGGISRNSNFRVNGNLISGTLDTTKTPPVYTFKDAPAYGDPNSIASMDEDYDACDLENWFLAIQSADGQIVVPSFHRPGILVYDPSATDPLDPTITGYDDWTSQSVVAQSKILRPRYADGHDATTFPNLYPDSTGKIKYDIDNDGDGITDSVWLDLGYPAKRNTEGQLYKPLFSFLVLGLNGRIPLNTAGNLQMRDVAGTPMFSHASHLGYSPSEIDPTFALMAPIASGTYNPTDDAGVPVNLTQLRNLLAGTRPQDAIGTSQDTNFVTVNGSPVNLPNGLYDQRDAAYSAAGGPPNHINTLTAAVPGRFGEPDAIPQAIPIGDVFTTSFGNQLNFGNTTPAPLASISSYTNPVRAGLSNSPYYSINSNASLPHALQFIGDSGDDNFNTFDPFPTHLSGTGLLQSELPVTTGTPLIPADYFDAAGAITLPIERLRRFVTPIDVAGDGLIVKPNQLNPSSQLNSPSGSGATNPSALTTLQFLVNTATTPPTPAPTAYSPFSGASTRGHLTYFKYFRPPGVPVLTPSSAIQLPTSLYYPGGLTDPSATGQDPRIPAPAIPDYTNNLYHGYEAARNPRVPTGVAVPNLFAGMPYERNAAPPTAPTPPTTTPTYDQYVNSIGVINTTTSPAGTNFLEFPTVPTAAGETNPFYAVSGALNEADELSLYQSTTWDQPYGPSDLEWLYRQQDSDGASLQSRLASLAPVSFLNAVDGLRRRRLFSTDTWELNYGGLAHDNPMGAFTANSHFGATIDANPANLSLFKGTTVATPSVAHRDRRINLNYPLPVSNSPIEPVRQKWIRETYQYLKTVLPPDSVDTPQELAQLSQFLVNVIDFRDPDCTMTKFVNTDIQLRQAAQMTDPTATPYYGTPPQWDYATTVSTIPYSPLHVESDQYLIQWGMESSPVAINEVLALQFTSKRTPGTAAKGATPNNVREMYVELVNTLSQDVSATNATALDMAGWDFVIMPDDTTGRPDPITGQVPYQNNSLSTTLPPPPGTAPFNPIQLSGKALSPQPAVTNSALSPSPIKGGTTYFVFGRDDSALKQHDGTTNVLKNPFSTAPTTGPTGTTIIMNPLDLSTSPAIAGAASTAAGSGKYFWLYLRRPPNPFETTFDFANPNDNRVVVDSFRFSFNVSSCQGYTDSMGDHVDGSTGESLYSLERLQPYRGGHAIQPFADASASPTSFPTNYSIPAYGFSEQIVPSYVGSGTAGSSNFYAQYGTLQSSGKVTHTLGAANNTSDPVHDLVPFHDRDFTSIAELMMVPGCPPGLFTKQFAEFVPPINMGTGTVAPLTTPPATSVAPTAAMTTNKRFTQTIPHTYPYLIDNFFYTATSESTTAPTWLEPPTGPVPVYSSTKSYVSTPLATTAAPAYIGGPGSAGWAKMLSIFEVPSPALGAIGPVAQGSNYDWARQDTRPGMVNLNLIVDEEVFFGLMSESWVKLLGVGGPSTLDVIGGTRLNVAQVPSAKPTPAVVTQINSAGVPTANVILPDSSTVSGAYTMPNVGFPAIDPLATPPVGALPPYDNRMKAAFSDFLKLRHGGSGYMFGFGQGGVSSPSTLPMERPFHSLSFPDIDFTVMRPASLPPSGDTLPPINTPGVTTGTFSAWTSAWPSTTPPVPPATVPVPPSAATTAPSATTGVVMDPGQKNQLYFMQNNPVQPPPIPPRRLFQLGDSFGTSANNAALGGVDFYVQGSTVCTIKNNIPPSNAGGSPQVFSTGPAPFAGDPYINTQVLAPQLQNPYGDLAFYSAAYLNIAPANVINGTNSNSTLLPPGTPAVLQGPFPYLGCNSTGDNSQHPYFRNDWLQKVTNLTTVRTHQYAVWITVGFFEVLQQGDPMVGNLQPHLAFDKLGPELGILSGRNIRYRSFFVIDRTKATGFNPQSPGNFRDCVVYRQTIE